MKFSRELLLDAHQGTVLLDVCALVWKEAEGEGAGWGGSNECYATSLAQDSLPGPGSCSFTPDKANTEAGAFVCGFKGSGF